MLLFRKIHTFFVNMLLKNMSDVENTLERIVPVKDTSMQS